MELELMIEEAEDNLLRGLHHPHCRHDDPECGGMDIFCDDICENIAAIIYY